MTAKEYLLQVQTLNRQVALMEEKCVAMRSLLYGRSVDYSKGGNKNYSNENTAENAICMAIDYENAIKSEIAELVKRRLRVEQSIQELIEDPLIREIFERKYLLFQTWEVISEEIHYTVQHLHRLHSKTLPKFEQLS